MDNGVVQYYEPTFANNGTGTTIRDSSPDTCTIAGVVHTMFNHACADVLDIIKLGEAA